jgi:hypothetical protein
VRKQVIFHPPMQTVTKTTNFGDFFKIFENCQDMILGTQKGFWAGSGTWLWKI